MPRHNITHDDWDTYVEKRCFRGISKEQYEIQVYTGLYRAKNSWGQLVGTGPSPLGLIQDLHRAIFQDVYPWAGELRTDEVAIGDFALGSKPDQIKDDYSFAAGSLASEFATPLKIPANLELVEDPMGLAKALERRAAALAAYHAMIIQVQPFQDGNGRVSSILTECQIERTFGKAVELSQDQDRYQNARYHALKDHNLAPLTTLILDAAGLHQTIADLKQEPERRAAERWLEQQQKELKPSLSKETLRVHKELPEHEYLHLSSTQEQAKEILINDWSKGGGITDPATHIIIAPTKSEAKDLNQRAQEERRKTGEIKPEQITINDTKFHVGDRIYFSEERDTLAIEKGNFGTITKVREDVLYVRLDEDRYVLVPTATYQSLSLGYAVPIADAQTIHPATKHILLGPTMKEQDLTPIASLEQNTPVHFYTDRGSANTTLRPLIQQIEQSSVKIVAHDATKADAREEDKRRAAELIRLRELEELQKQITESQQRSQKTEQSQSRGR